MDWRAAIKRTVPPFILNNAFLALPVLYRSRIVNYETNISADGIADLTSQLGLVLELAGHIVECGSSRCGASVIMANYLRSRSAFKAIYACDSFAGFDLEELRRERVGGLTTAPESAFTSTSYGYVQKKIRKLGVADIIVPIRGFFQDTLPHIHSSFCFALIDCDLRQSVIYCAESIWPNLVSKGRILFDDYASRDFKGARLGIEQFICEHSNEIEEHGLLKRLYMVRKA